MNSFFDGAFVTEIRSVAKIYTQPNKHVECPPRSCHGIVYFLEGNCEYIYGNTVIRVSPGSILYMPKGVPYVIRRLAPSQCYYINFDAVVPEEFPAFCISLKNGSQFCEAFKNAVSVYGRRKVGYEFELFGITYKLLSMLQASKDSTYLPSSGFKKISPAVEYIEGHYYNDEIRIPMLAKLCGMSVRYFSHLFSAYYGIPPKEYIINRQLELAKSILLSTSESIGNVAASSGFADLYYFSRYFKKAFGVTPSEYRRQYQII